MILKPNKCNQTDIVIAKNILSKNECDKIIRLANKEKWDTDVEVVDGYPLWQIDIFGGSNKTDNNIWDEHVKKIYNNKIFPYIKKCKRREKWMDKKYNLDWVYIRKYNKDDRSDLVWHADETRLSIIIPLNNEYTGGRLYYFNKLYSELLDDIQTSFKTLKHTDEIKLKKELFRITDKYSYANIKQGDLFILSGSTIHGISPVKSGERYSMVLFFNMY